MKLKYIGHSCFLLTSEKTGARALCDPYAKNAYGDSFRYEPVAEVADLVTISHDHADHNGAGDLPGSPEVIRTAGEHEVKGARIVGVEFFHDAVGGAQRGKNIVFCLELDGLKVCHCGDLGHLPTAEELRPLGLVDVLLVPVGGHFTIDGPVADQLIELLQPRLVVPMHYKTACCDFPIAELEDYLDEKENVIELTRSELVIPTAELPDDTQIMVIPPANCKEVQAL